MAERERGEDGRERGGRMAEREREGGGWQRERERGEDGRERERGGRMAEREGGGWQRERGEDGREREGEDGRERERGEDGREREGERMAERERGEQGWTSEQGWTTSPQTRREAHLETIFSLLISLMSPELSFICSRWTVEIVTRLPPPHPIPLHC